MMYVYQHHRDQREVVRSGDRQQHEDLCHEPVAARHWRREDTFDESIRAGARHGHGGERNEGERHEEDATTP